MSVVAVAAAVFFAIIKPPKPGLGFWDLGFGLAFGLGVAILHIICQNFCKVLYLNFFFPSFPFS